MKRQDRVVIEAVARHFSATYGKSDNSADACVTVAGKRIDVDVATLKSRATGRAGGAPPRLRFDKVVVRLMVHLQVTLGKTVPDGGIVLLTITAPIRVASKTASALEAKIQTLLQRGSPRRDVTETIFGNRIRIRFWRGQSGSSPKLIGFVHNSGSNPNQLLDMACEFLDLVIDEAGGRATDSAPNRPAGRWLFVTTTRGISCIQVFRSIYSQVCLPAGYKKVLMLFRDGRIGILNE
ncbi:MAG TPA: hypothetical protein VGS15_06290 [Candidatus Acidoferrales bacterium]|nr:hypothetical protein [Candidatus Acidoferrales bacterium]